MSTSVIETICAAAAMTMLLQSMVLGIVLISKKSFRNDANLALAGASFAFGLSMIHSLMAHLHLGEDWPNYFWIGLRLPIPLIPPLTYLHMIGALSEAPWSFRREHWRHGAPAAAIILLFMIGAALGLPPDFHWPETIFAGEFARAPAFVPAAIGLIVWYGVPLITLSQGGWYILRILRLTRGSKSASILWLRLLLLVVTVFLALFALVQALSLVQRDDGMVKVFAHVTAVAMLYGISWASLHHGPIFERTPSQFLQDLVAGSGKYRKSAQSPDDAVRILTKLEKVIAQEALHRDAGLTLPLLAAKIGASPNFLSQALNQQRKQNFFDYINDFRIDDAKQMLVTPVHEAMTILDIAYASGFNSKSTFNDAFKKRTGKTPRQFRQENRPVERTSL